ncbi:MAG: hypothetical protein GC137_10815 [Alphaproteobacteria bacterium]|nr:hypothetical protein [Alphaproteobacteria bacterium]
MFQKLILTAIFASFIVISLPHAHAQEPKQTERRSAPDFKSSEQKRQDVIEARRKMIGMGKDIEKDAIRQNEKNEKSMRIEYERETREEEKDREENPDRYRELP